MTREEAIKILKARPYSGEVLEALETLVPELAESEDERIRKGIVAAVEMYGDFTQRQKEEIYAYLKKQKEQPTNEEMLRTLHVEYEKGVADTIAKYEQKEQNVVPSRETILGIWELGNFWKENPEERDGLTQLQYIQKYWFEKCDYQKKQKPTEWSMEDKQNQMINLDHFKSYMLQYLQDAANRKDDSEIEKDTDIWAKKLLNLVNIDI